MIEHTDIIKATLKNVSPDLFQKSLRNMCAFSKKYPTSRLLAMMRYWITKESKQK